MKKAIVQFICFLSISQAAFAITPHIEKLENIPLPFSEYSILDLGETDLDPIRLSRLHKSYSFAPRISNTSNVTWNSSKGGTFKSLCSLVEFAPVFDGMQIYFVALNDQADILIAISRNDHKLEWMLWKAPQNGCGERVHIASMEQFNPNVILSMINNQGTVVGFSRCDSLTKPVQWTLDSSLRSIGTVRSAPNFDHFQKVDARGIAKAVNNCSSIAGIYSVPTASSPFIWNSALDFQLMPSSKTLQPSGWHEFADLVLTDDNTVYGTYWVRYGSTDDTPHGANPYYGYIWHPNSGKIANIDLMGMRIAAVNSSHLLVGSCGGKAAIKEAERAPIFLEQLISEEDLKNWQLIEATDVNDKGQIVGYGRLKGKMHIFLAEKKEAAK